MYARFSHVYKSAKKEYNVFVNQYLRPRRVERLGKNNIFASDTSGTSAHVYW